MTGCWHKLENKIRKYISLEIYIYVYRYFDYLLHDSCRTNSWKIKENTNQSNLFDGNLTDCGMLAPTMIEYKKKKIK